MKSPLGTLAKVVNKAPVPYVGRVNTTLQALTGVGNNREAQMRAMGSVGTLFATVHRTSNATSQVGWSLYRKSRTGDPEDRTEVTTHAALDLWSRPNRFFPRQLFVETFQQHLDLVGEAWWVIGRDQRATLPLELWPIRPDRMEPVPSRIDYLAGYVYTGPDGEKVPLGLDDVVFLRMPNPLDPYRGMGPVQAILTDLDSERYSAEWNRNFFLNSAEPGGLIRTPNHLDDDEFNEFQARWAEQHKGVAAAHRVGMLEAGMEWVERKYTMRDMQFVELRKASRELILEAFGMSKTMLGQTESVNRATAEAAEYVFSKWQLGERLARIKGALNEVLLPLFASNGRADVWEFDHDEVVPENAEADNAERDSRVSAVVALIGAGADPAATLEAFELPEIPFSRPAPAPQQLPAAPDETAAVEQALARLASHQGHRHPRPPRRTRNADDPPDLDPEELPDVSHLQESWERALDDLLDQWAGLEDDQKDELVDLVREIAESGRLEDLAGLSVDTDATTDALTAAMVAIAAEAAEQLAEEAAEQGTEVEPQEADGSVIGEVAAVVAAVRAAALAAGAAVAAMRANGPDATPDDVAEAVREHLDSLSEDGPRPLLGGALTGAQNAGRIETLRSAPEGALYANEVNDRNTCGPCREVNGRWLGNISEMDRVLKSYPGGAFGGYVHCEGRERCRGTLTGVWRS